MSVACKVEVVHDLDLERADFPAPACLDTPLRRDLPDQKSGGPQTVMDETDYLDIFDGTLSIFHAVAQLLIMKRKIVQHSSVWASRWINSLVATTE